MNNNNQRKFSDITETRYVLKYITEDDDNNNYLNDGNFSFNKIDGRKSVSNGLQDLIPDQLYGEINESKISPIEKKTIKFNHRGTSNFLDPLELTELSQIN